MCLDIFDSRSYLSIRNIVLLNELIRPTIDLACPTWRSTTCSHVRSCICYIPSVLLLQNALTFHTMDYTMLLVGDFSIRELVLSEKDSGWMDLRVFNLHVLGSLWLIAKRNHFGRWPS